MAAAVDQKAQIRKERETAAEMDDFNQVASGAQKLHNQILQAVTSGPASELDKQQSKHANLVLSLRRIALDVPESHALARQQLVECAYQMDQAFTKAYGARAREIATRSVHQQQIGGQALGALAVALQKLSPARAQALAELVVTVVALEMKQNGL